MNDEDARNQAEADSLYARWRQDPEPATLDKVTWFMTWRPTPPPEHPTDAHPSSPHLATTYRAVDQILADCLKSHHPDRRMLATALSCVTRQISTLVQRLETGQQATVARLLADSRRHLDATHHRLDEILGSAMVLVTDWQLKAPTVAMDRAQTAYDRVSDADQTQLGEITTLLAAIVRAAAGAIRVVDLVEWAARNGITDLLLVPERHQMRGGTQWWEPAASLTLASYTFRACAEAVRTTERALMRPGTPPAIRVAGAAYAAPRPVHREQEASRP